MIVDQAKFEDMKAFAENAGDVVAVSVPKEDMAAIADTAIKLWEVVYASAAARNYTQTDDLPAILYRLGSALDALDDCECGHKPRQYGHTHSEAVQVAP